MLHTYVGPISRWTHIHTHNGNPPSVLLALTRCTAEQRGGCGWISNRDGVCPNLWIRAPVAYGRNRDAGRHREGERRGESVREWLSQSICIKVMGQCVT